MELAQEYMVLPEHVRGGSLCMYGVYVGRPLDMCHDPTAASYEDDKLTLEFGAGMRIEIWEPRGVHVEGRGYTVGRARKVLYSRARPPDSVDNVDTRLYEIVAGELVATTSPEGLEPGNRRHAALTIC